MGRCFYPDGIAGNAGSRPDERATVSFSPTFSDTYPAGTSSIQQADARATEVLWSHIEAMVNVDDRVRTCPNPACCRIGSTKRHLLPLRTS
jgi:hypothetical protein